MGKSELRKGFYRAVAEVLAEARQNAYRAVNTAMVEAYWRVGRLIVEEEQRGKARADYGAFILQNLAARLTHEFGRGFTEANLRNFRQFYLAFPSRGEGSEIRYALRSELTWTHYRLLMRVENPSARAYYLAEAADQGWSSRALERQIHSLYFERLLASRERRPVEAEGEEATRALAERPEAFIKDPYVLEFLDLAPDRPWLEKDLEQALLDKLQHFLLELGKGFAFVARQQRIATETKEFYIDLVFYNYLLRCFVLIDLKTGELAHQDIGQMDMYVRLYEDQMRVNGDNPTIGIILCTEKDQTVVKYSILSEGRRIFASRYRLYLPTELELMQEVEREKALFLREHGK